MHARTAQSRRVRTIPVVGVPVGPCPGEPGRRTLRVTLVRPPVLVPLRGLSGKGPVPPLGLAYIAAALEAAGHQVEVVDATDGSLTDGTDIDSPVGPLRRYGMSAEEVVACIPEDTDVVGISHMFLHEWTDVRTIARLVKARSQALVVAGGENATAFARWILETCPAVDACVLGEGEATIVTLLDRWAAGLPLGDIPGVQVGRAAPAAPPSPAGEGPAARLAPRLQVDDGTIPRPAWHLVPLEGYLDAPSSLGVERGRSMPVLATRGCPYRCSFCSAPQMWTTRYSVRSPTDVVDEIESYVDRYGVENVDFCDLTFATKRKWTLEFCEELRRRRLGITWQLPAGTRSEILDEEVLRAMRDSGCCNITLAAESGSRRLLELFDKRVDTDLLLERARTASSLGIRTHLNVIIGHPSERWTDRWATARLLVRAALAGCETASPILFAAYPGSADFDALMEAGEIELDDAFTYVGLTRGGAGHPSFHPTTSATTLFAVQTALTVGFHLVAMARHPSRILRCLRTLTRRREENHMDQILHFKLRTARRGRPAARSMS